MESNSIPRIGGMLCCETIPLEETISCKFAIATPLCSPFVRGNKKGVLKVLRSYIRVE